MGILDNLGLGRRRPDLLTPPNLRLASPWAEGSLTSLVVADMLGQDVADALPVGRAEAIMLPAVSKARNLLVSTIAKFPIAAYAQGTRLADQPTFLYRTNGPVSPYTRMVWTIDDGIFYGCSLWLVERGADRAIHDARWCPFDWWEIDDDGRILVSPDGSDPKQPVDADSVILFDFPFEGLLTVGARTLRGARDQERAWVGRTRNPLPVIDLHRTEENELDDDEVTELVNDWAAARMNPNGAVGSTPAGIELHTYGETPVDLMVEGRNAVRTDIGSFLNVRVAMLDGTIGVDSLTYTTNEGEKNSFFELDLPFWVDPIEARLSLDDVVPRGQTVRFEMYQAYPLPTGPALED